MGLRPAKSHEKLGGDADWPDGGADPLVRAGRPRPAAGPTISAPCRSPAGRRGRRPRTRGSAPPSPEGLVFRPCHSSQQGRWLTDDKKRSSVPPASAPPFLRKQTDVLPRLPARFHWNADTTEHRAAMKNGSKMRGKMRLEWAKIALPWHVGSENTIFS
jgi:hypothetical protein